MYNKKLHALQINRLILSFIIDIVFIGSYYHDCMCRKCLNIVTSFYLPALPIDECKCFSCDESVEDKLHFLFDCTESK